MPNLERRYTSQDGPLADAWIFGMIDALEFLQLGHEYHKNATGWFEMTASQLIEDITKYADEYWREEFAKVEGRDTIPVSKRSSGPDNTEKKSVTSGPTWSREDSGSTEQSGGDGPIQPGRQPRHSHSHPSCKCEERLDSDYRRTHLTEIPTDGCGGSGRWFINEEGYVVGACACLASYFTDNSSR